VMWAALLADLKLTGPGRGNAYLHVVRNDAKFGGVPVGLYWMPTALVEPRWDDNNPTVFITHYEYTVNGKKQRLEVDEVIHFREVLNDPNNTRKGWSRLNAALREIATDNEAANSVYTIARNKGYGILHITPNAQAAKDGGLDPKVIQEAAPMIEAKIEAKTTGDNRGRSVYHTIPVDFFEPGAKLADLASESLRRIPETRVCAILGIPPGVVKLLSGLERNTMSNATTEERQAWNTGIKPVHGIFEDEIDFKLLPMFEPNPENFAFKFDTSGVEALKPDLKMAADTWVPVFKANVMKRSQIQERLGLVVDDQNDGYFSEVGGLPDNQPGQPAALGAATGRDADTDTPGTAHARAT
jgi:hypothetical protein